MSEPNYRALSAPSEKDKEEYTYAERRAEIYDAIEYKGHYRNLERSTRELGDEYDVSHTTIRRDITAVNEWIAEHLGTGAEAELETLKTKAVQDLLDSGDTKDVVKAYELMADHYDILLEAGAAEQESDPDKHEHTGEGGSPLDVTINRERYSEDDHDEDEGDSDE